MLVRLSLTLMIAAAVGGVWLWLEGGAEPAPARLAAPEDRDRALRLFHDAAALKGDGRQARAAFRAAAQALQPLADSPATFQDLGAAYLLGGRLPEAIFAFGAGLKLDPDDSGLRERLRYARALVPYAAGERGKPRDDWPLWLPTLPTLLRLGAFVCYALAFCFATLALTRGREVLLGWSAFFTVFLFGQVVAFRWMANDLPLVVVKEPAALRLGNGASYPTHAEAPFLPPGLEAHVVARRGGWLLIELTSGETGWVAGEDVLVEMNGG